MRRESIHRTGRTETDERKRRGGGGGRVNDEPYIPHPSSKGEWTSEKERREEGRKEGKRERRTKKLRYRRIIKLYNEEEGEGEGVGRRRNEIARR